MSDFDKGRCVRVINNWIEDQDEILKERESDDSYTSPEAFLKDDAELREDRKAMVGLREHLERDCE
jgi:hypothetical protein